MNLTFSISPRLGIFGRALAAKFKSIGLRECFDLGDAFINFVDSVDIPIRSSALNVLMLIEPKSVLPANYLKHNWQEYVFVSAMGRYRSEHYGLETWFDLPFNIDFLGWGSDSRKSIVMVNASKFSANRDSLYSLRRKILLLDKSRRRAIKLYGDHWNESRSMESRRRFAAARSQLRANFREYSHSEAWSEFGVNYPQHQGKMDSNFNQSRNAKLAVVVENEGDYISEKIWIFLNRGVVPIYIGVSLERHEFIKNFIFTDFDSLESVVDFIDHADDRIIRTKIENYINFENEYKPSQALQTSVNQYFHSIIEKLGVL